MSDNSAEPAPAQPTITGAPSTTTTAKKTASTRLPSLNQLAARISSSQAAANGGAAPRGAAFCASSPPCCVRVAHRHRINDKREHHDVEHRLDGREPVKHALRLASDEQRLERNRERGRGRRSAHDGGTGEARAGDSQRRGRSCEGAARRGARKKVGYKNIPSLDAIAGRLAKQRASQLSVDGSTMPPEPEMIEDPKDPWRSDEGTRAPAAVPLDDIP